MALTDSELSFLKEPELDLESASRVNPDLRAESIGLAADQGMPLSVVESNIEEIRRRQKAQITPGPKLKTWLTDNAEIAHDDLDVLQGLEDEFSSDTPDVEDYAWSLGAGLLKGTGMAMEGVGQTYDVAVRTLDRKIKENVSSETYESLRTPADDLISKFAPGKIVTKQGEAVKQLGTSITSEHENLGTQIIEGLGQVAGQIGVASVSAPASMAMLFGQGVSQQAEKQKESGAYGATDLTDTGLLLGGATTAITEKIIGLDPLMKHIPSAVRGKVVSKLAGVFLGGGAEAVQEVAEGIMQNVVERYTSNEKAEIFGGDLTREAIVAGSVGAITEAIILAAVPGRGGRVSQSNKNNRTLEKVVELSKKSKTSKRAKQQYQEYLQSLGDHEVYIPEEALEHLDVPDYIETQMDGLGGDVQMPMDVFLSDFIEYEDLLAQVMPHVRIGEDTLSSSELETEQKELKGILDNYGEVTQEDKDIDAITDKIESGLIDTERSSAKNARTTASIMTEYIKTKSKRLDMSVNDVAERMNLVIKKQEAVEPSENLIVDQLADVQDFGDKITEEEYTIAETGKKVKVKKTLQKEWDYTQKRRDTVERLRDCLNA